MRVTLVSTYKKTDLRNSFIIVLEISSNFRMTDRQHMVRNKRINVELDKFKNDSQYAPGCVIWQEETKIIKVMLRKYPFRGF